ncbi:hypothetical protein PPL_09771 [Heterostelium album PN500]|uniref:Uncharacterized protein n=1 Tax=Heterostelium pallidum (strain ATCC 26659 / Pp 5 / PN500) TaxID=670386 RepID=D3BP09_HETP5|nr:hypothetical protein PPL_09771 [Heterostelium album PN500]EFA77019.1 hypothetical protein PPL_09771 [Heterostelium album PN500]|eukprot:XP_020429149.1 hypothetical protein PPL_09771 [Heterostelium album PN500]
MLNILKFLENHNTIIDLNTFVSFNNMIYQIGEDCEQGRFSKGVFEDVQFVQTLLEVIKERITSLSSEDQYSLVFFVQLLSLLSSWLIDSNLLVLNIDVKRLIYECRTKAKEWMRLLYKDNNSLDSNSQIQDTQLVFTSMALILSMESLTIGEDQDELGHNDFYFHLKSNYILFEKFKNIEFPNSIINISLLHRCSVITFKMIPAIQSIISKSPTVLSNYIMMNEPCFNEPNAFMEWKQLKDSHLWYCQYDINDAIQLNINNGNIIFNGSSSHQLPNNISSKPDFIMLFANTKFSVKFMKSRYVIKIKDRNYELQLTPNGHLQVKEIQDGGDTFDLIPSELLKDLPKSLTKEYTLWKKYDDSIEFRPKQINKFFDKFEPKFSGNIDGIIVQFNTTNELVNLKTTMDGQLESHLHTVFKIDSPENILVWKTHSKIIIQLVQHKDLLFEIIEDAKEGTITYSRSFTICDNQYMGTMVGLSNYLLLENNHTKEKIVLTPHSILSVEQGDMDFKDYQVCQADVNSLDTPSYFRYKIDDNIKVLTPQEITSNLYLAYLHLMTSSTMPDPFLGQTGFDMAVTLLQRFQTNRLFTTQSIAILKRIQSISPTRKLFSTKEHNAFQEVEYKYPLIPGFVCHDFINMLVSSVISHNQECQFLYESCKDNVQPNTQQRSTKSFIFTSDNFTSEILGIFDARLFRIPDRNVMDFPAITISSFYMSLLNLAKSIRLKQQPFSKLILFLTFQNLIALKPSSNHSLFDHIIYLSIPDSTNEEQFKMIPFPEAVIHTSPHITHKQISSDPAWNSLFQEYELIKVPKLEVSELPTQFIKYQEEFKSWQRNYRLFIFLKSLQKISFKPDSLNSQTPPILSSILNIKPKIIRYSKSNDKIDWKDNDFQIEIDERLSNLFKIGYDPEIEDYLALCLVEKQEKYTISDQLDQLLDHEESTKIGSIFYDELEKSKDHLISHIESTPTYELVDQQYIEETLSQLYKEINDAKTLVWSQIESIYNSNWTKLSSFIKCGLWKQCNPVNIYKDFIDYVDYPTSQTKDKKVECFRSSSLGTV